MKNLNVKPIDILYVTEDVYYEQIMEFEINSTLKISFRNDDFNRNFFKDLKNIISKKNYDEIIAQQKFNYSENIYSCTGVFGKQIRFLFSKINNKYFLVLLASVEIQRSFYEIYLEGIWEFEEGEILGELK
jgi:hypothetical protein